jgi:hypothetical protein
MTIKERLPIHKRTYPYFLLTLGLLFGLGIAIDWDIKISGMWDVSFKTQFETEKSAWDIVAAIGSLLAGLSTVGLLVFGWFKGNEWIKQIRTTKRLDTIVLELNNLRLKSAETALFIEQELNKIASNHSNRLNNKRLTIDQFAKQTIELTEQVWPHMSTILAIYSSSNKYKLEFSQLGKVQGELIKECSTLIKEFSAGKKDIDSRMILIYEHGISLSDLARALMHLIIKNELSEE